MNDTSTNDFITEELKLITDTERADIELRVYEGDRELTPCPAIYWEHADCHFILAKAADNKFFSPFFYRNSQQFGTAKPFYDDLHNCVVTLLQAQTDHELKNLKKQHLN